jgi:hypothetical protein
VTDAADRIKQLAAWRARPDRGREVKADVSGFARDLRRLEKTIGAASDAWVRIAPPELQRWMDLGPLANERVLMMMPYTIEVE